MLGCRCNGKADIFGYGGECANGKNGKWCYVNKHACNKTENYNGKFISTTPCTTEPNPNKPCVCNGVEDIFGLGGSCENGGVFCYVDKDANCPDITQHNGKPASRHACKGNNGKLFLLLKSYHQ